MLVGGRGCQCGAVRAGVRLATVRWCRLHRSSATDAQNQAPAALPLSGVTPMEELEKLMTDDPNANQSIILREMDYLGNVEDTIHTLNVIYPNPKSLKSYINVLTVITSHLKVFQQVYQQYTRIGIEINKRIQEKRDDNELNDNEQERTIPLDKPTILKGLEKLKYMREK